MEYGCEKRKRESERGNKGKGKEYKIKRLKKEEHKWARTLYLERGEGNWKIERGREYWTSKGGE